VLSTEVARLEGIVREAKGYLLGNETKERIMAQSMLRALYRGLLYLHPPAFRKRFAEEDAVDFR